MASDSEEIDEHFIQDTEETVISGDARGNLRKSENNQNLPVLKTYLHQFYN